MVNSCAVCGCCTRTDIVREHLEDTLRICDVSAKGLFYNSDVIGARLEPCAPGPALPPGASGYWIYIRQISLTFVNSSITTKYLWN